MEAGIKKAISDLLDIKGDFLRAAEKDRSDHPTEGFYMLTQATKLGYAVELLTHDKLALASKQLEALEKTGSLESSVKRYDATLFLYSKKEKAQLIASAEHWEKCATVCKKAQQAINP